MKIRQAEQYLRCGRIKVVLAAIFIHFASYGAMASGSAGAVTLESLGTRWLPFGSLNSEFMITNASSNTIQFSGYGRSMPIYTAQIRLQGDWCKQPEGLYCPVGLESISLMPRESMAFTVPALPGEDKWRIGIEFTHSDLATGSNRIETVWSPAVTNAPESEIASAASNPTSLARIDVTWHAERDYPYTFKLVNVSVEPLYYGGFAERDVPPIYFGQERRGKEWQDSGVAKWCGSRLGFYELKAGGSIEFSIPAQSLDTTWRIGIRLFKKAEPRSPQDAYRIIWSHELPPRGTPPTNLPSSSLSMPTPSENLDRR
jgi:hypothetical protein